MFPFCVPHMAVISRVKVPNEPLRKESLAIDKGVLREEESEGSLTAKVMC